MACGPSMPTGEYTSYDHPGEEYFFQLEKNKLGILGELKLHTNTSFTFGWKGKAKLKAWRKVKKKKVVEIPGSVKIQVSNNEGFSDLRKGLGRFGLPAS